MALVSPTASTESLRERLLQNIILGVLPQRMKLKLEPASRRYDASVNMLRETLSRLSADGLVAAEAQMGVTALAASPQDLREIDEKRPLQERHALRQLRAAAPLDGEARVIAAHHKLSRVEEAMEDEPERLIGAPDTSQRDARRPFATTPYAEKSVLDGVEV